MIHRKPIQGFSVVSAMLVIVASATILSIGTTTTKVEAQNAATQEQIKDYLMQAIQALDNGDNTKAAQQLKLAADQIDGSTGVSTISSNGESDGEGAEEGPGEDEDEPGDVDQNDEED